MTVEEFISKWSGLAGGAESANFGPFIYDLVRALDLPEPEPAEGGKLGPYQFEGPIPNASFRNPQNKGSADLYKRGCFIMEAKQSYMPPKEQRPPELFGDDAPLIPLTPAGARYDKYMTTARAQVENYAKNLPAAEPVAPFLIVCDIGRAFEIYHDGAGNGRGYSFFPDKQSYRIPLAKLRDPDIVVRLKAIWTDPKSIDPRFQSADVTREVAKRLASVSQYIEEGLKLKLSDKSPREKAGEIEEAALFLMRILFCMFAEDIGLLPKDKFSEFLKRAESNEQLLPNQLPNLWHKMGHPVANRFADAIEQDVKYFNGNLFKGSTRTYPLGGFVIHDLYEAARQNWRKVEPAIFGTLLEQALSPEERAKLGAHYTPRPYVETLVRATIMDVLEPEWAGIEVSEEQGLLDRAQAFHERLAALRVLDPACGTGNFLYVAMELMQALEARVIETIQTLGGHAEPRVGPHQFYGLEKNPRAAKIAELVLWIGWLRNRLHDDPDSVPQPVLAESANINFGEHGGYDAVLKMSDLGQPDLEKPLVPDWPEAEFIVGNPPFIGKGGLMRSYLGDDYVEALQVANPRVPASADFVMQWWDRAAHTLVAKDSPLIRFGLVTTNSITQEFNRRVIANYLRPSTADETALSLVMAIPDHPWTKATKDAAAVRIAMTVAERGEHEGELREVNVEEALDSDEPRVVLSNTVAAIHANLTTGADITATKSLKANEGLSCNGMMLAGQGFKLSEGKARKLAAEEDKDVSGVLKGYVGGSELLSGWKRQSVIDFCGLTEEQARKEYPVLYQHLLSTVKPERDQNRRPALKNRWWIFAEPRKTFRPALEGLGRYIGTTETSKHRVFQFVEATIVPDHMVVAVASDDAFHLGVLQSKIHTDWALAAGGWLGVGNDPRYSKSKVFDPFPFPGCTPEQRAKIATLAEELDKTRKDALAETEKLTMTELYNLSEKLRTGVAMDDKEQRRATKARAGIIGRLHEQLNQAVADAYGWGEEWKADALDPPEIVARLVALNRERRAEECNGKTRWLRPEYQEPRFGKK